MCHFMLPTRGMAYDPDALDGRYGDDAMALLLCKMVACSAPVHEFQFKLFGGGRMFCNEEPDVNVLLYTDA